MPGTDVGIERNGPPVSVPGLGSQVSSWLEPPASQSRMTCFPLALEVGGHRRRLQDVERRHVGGEGRGTGGHGAEEAATIEGMLGRAAEKGATRLGHRMGSGGK